MESKRIFLDFYLAQTEEALDTILSSDQIFAAPSNWLPLGGNESNCGIVENQKAYSVDALIEKITNSIDAILMRKCYEAGRGN